MTDVDLTGRGHTSSTHIADARQLRADVEAAGGELPPVLHNLLNAHEMLAAAPAAQDSTTTIISAAASGELTPKQFEKMINDAALATAAREFRSNLARRASRDLVARFGAELVNGAADQIVASLTPRFDAAAQRIGDALQLVDLGQDYAQFVETAEPESLSAFQGLRSAVAVVDGIIGLVVRHFGGRSITWPQIIPPAAAVDELGGVEDAAWWVTPPGSSVGLWSNAIREHRGVLESQATIKPVASGMRYSPWLRGGLAINTPTQVREHVRAFAEVAIDNHTTPSLAAAGYPNPFRQRAEVAGDVEVFGPDGSIAEVV